MTLDPVELKWTSKLTVSPASRTFPLQGDKIILPPSALEQLLSASTVIADDDAPSQRTAFGRFGPAGFPSLADGGVPERQQNLPHPLTFRLVNSRNGNVAYAGIREFSAEEGEVGVSSFLREVLGLNEEDLEEAALTVHAKQLPKGKFVRLRPLESYLTEDWKPILERHLRNTFTTLVSGEVFVVPSGKEEFRFLVDKTEPGAEAICIVDTDLEVDIEALNEEQARETLKKRLAKNERPQGSGTGSSEGGMVEVGGSRIGKVLPGDYVDYTLEKWDRSRGLVVELNVDDDDLVDIFISPLAPRQRSLAREDEHVFAAIEGSPRQIVIRSTNVELDDAESLQISVHGYPVKDQAAEAKREKPLPYTMTISATGSLPNGTETQAADAESPSAQADETQCKNCHAWVPSRTLVLHESFCLRNNVLCPTCRRVFQKSSSAWKQHWHCPHDSSHGDSPASRAHHNGLHHTPRVCPACAYATLSTLTLATHRTTICPAKPILCRFCHLVVPQQGPDDPSATEPEVLLSGLTPHELRDGARTNDCPLCGRPVRLRDWDVHARHHDFERRARRTPAVCRNQMCGRTLPPPNQTHAAVGLGVYGPNPLGLCAPCFGPLYASGGGMDADGRALRRRVERRGLTQFLSGCGRAGCGNVRGCRTARDARGLPRLTSKDATAALRPMLEGLADGTGELWFCVDAESQGRREAAGIMAAYDGEGDHGYAEGWYVKALEESGGDMGKARMWLENWAPRKREASA